MLTRASSEDRSLIVSSKGPWYISDGTRIKDEYAIASLTGFSWIVELLNKIKYILRSKFDYAKLEDLPEELEPVVGLMLDRKHKRLVNRLKPTSNTHITCSARDKIDRKALLFYTRLANKLGKISGKRPNVLELVFSNEEVEIAEENESRVRLIVPQQFDFINSTIYARDGAVVIERQWGKITEQVRITWDGEQYHASLQIKIAWNEEQYHASPRQVISNEDQTSSR